MTDRKKGNDSLPLPQSASGNVRSRRGLFTRRVLPAVLAAVAVVGLSQLVPAGFQLSRKTPLGGKKAEEVFLSVPNEASCTSASRLYTSKPHMAGTEGDFDTAKEFLHLLQRELGIEAPSEDPIFPAGSPESQSAILSISHAHKPRAWIDVYYPVMNTPMGRAVQLLDDSGFAVWDADLEEHADDEDPDAGKYRDAVPTFHGLSKGGDVTGKLIHVNYGMKEDYDELVAQGVDFKGAIVLARYGSNFRGLKVKAAEELGAAGVIIYSDPRDDGAVTVQNGYKPYPQGPARNPTSVQRGSVQYLSMYPGDPTTPGVPAYPNSTRTSGENIPGIPSLPISWQNAQKLLSSQGETVRLLNNVDTKVTPIWNSMAVIPGLITDEVVVLGNHRDAWVLGASDPTSGTASLHETIRGFGELLKGGWKPLRTIVLASWDAEEYGLIGSTEWGEDFSKWIQANVVAYLNLDGSASGARFSAQASPLLSHLVKEAADDIPHPTDANRTLWDAGSDVGPYFDPSFQDIRGLESMADTLGVGVLGSGSDYTVFLQHLGIPSMNHGFGGAPGDAVYHYHSVYDTERWVELYADPGFFRHVAVAKHLGLITLRLADSIILPLNTTHYSLELEAYLDKVAEIASANSFAVDLEPLRKSIQSLQAESLKLDSEKEDAEAQLIEAIKKSHQWRFSRIFKKLFCGLEALLGLGDCSDMTCGARGERALIRALHAHLPPSTTQVSTLLSLDIFRAWRRVRAVNQKLRTFEQGLLSAEGIPEREWYKHLGVAPGKWLGYGATTLPALTESLTIEHSESRAAYEAGRLKQLIDGLEKSIQV